MQTASHGKQRNRLHGRHDGGTRAPAHAHGGAARRLAIAVLGTTLLIVAAGAAATVLAVPVNPAPTDSRAFVMSVNGSASGAVQAKPTVTPRVVTASFEASTQASSLTGTASTSSGLSGRALQAASQVDISDVNLLGGIVTARRIVLVAHASATVLDVAADTDGARVDGLAVNGQPVDPQAGPVSIPGVGTMTCLTATIDASGGSASAQILGLRIALDSPVAGLPAGTVLVVGAAAARADHATLASLLPPSPTPKPTPRPTATARPTPRPTPRPTSSTVTPTNSGYQPMPAPGTVPGGLLDFPGAVFPVAGRYWFSNDWHAPRAVGRWHTGIDIFAEKGTPLVAVQDGYISKMALLSLGGISLRLTNRNGDYFYYAHLSAYAPGLFVGEQVSAGQVIGFVGNTGNARFTPSHCHFEIHPGGGDPINPYPYLQLWRGATMITALPAGGTAAGAVPLSTDTLVTPARRSAVLRRLAQTERNLDVFTSAGGSSDDSVPPVDPVSSLPLVVIVAVGTAVYKRLQWTGMLL